MGLRNWLKKLERDSSSDLESFELLDGTNFYYDSGGEVYMYCWRCLEVGHPDNWPEPPALLAKVLEAEDPAGALDTLWSEGIADLFPFDRDVLINERRLVPRSIVAGRDVHDQEVQDLSE